MNNPNVNHHQALWALLAIATTLGCRLEASPAPAPVTQAPPVILSPRGPVAPPTTNPSPPPTPPAYCRVPEMPGSVGALQPLPQTRQVPMAEPIIFDGAPHETGSLGGSWPYLQVAYNTRQKEYLAVWTQDPTSSETEQGLYIQRLGANGRPIAPATRLSTSPSRRFEFPRIAASADRNGYMLVWSDGLQQVAYAWHLDGTGAPVGTPRSLGEGSHAPIVINNPTRSEYLVTWQAPARSDGCHVPVGTTLAQRLSSDGEPLASPFTLIDSPSQTYGYNVVHNSRADEYLLIRTASPGYGLHVQRFVASGKLVGDSVPIPVGANPQPMYAPAIAYHPGLDEYLITWGDGDRDAGDIFARHLAPNGRQVGEAIRVTQDPANERASQILPTTDGYLLTILRTVTIRYDNGTSSHTTTTRGQRITGDALLGPDASLDLGALGMAVAAGPSLETFLAFGRDVGMTTQMGRFPAAESAPAMQIRP